MLVNTLENEKLPTCHFTGDMKKTQPDWVLPGLRAGQVGVIAAPGGTGKSYLLMEIALSVALGQQFITGIPVSHAGPVRLLNFEDDEIDMMNRGIDILDTLEIYDPSPLDEVFYVHPLAGYRLDIVTRAGDVNESAVSWLMRMAEGMRLLVLDPLSHIASCDENDNATRTLLVQVLKHVAREKGCAVLVAHHTNKGDSDKEQGWLRGASALVDAARYVVTLQKFIDSWRLRLQWVKLNGCPPMEDICLKRERNGVILRDHESELTPEWNAKAIRKTMTKLVRGRVS